MLKGEFRDASRVGGDPQKTLGCVETSPGRRPQKHERSARHVEKMLVKVALDETDDLGRDHIFV